MVKRKRHGIPARLESTRRRFERWRQQRSVGTRIPDSLWAAAVKMAGIYGISQTATTLRVDYYSLKRRIEREGQSSPISSGGEAASPFVELPPVQTGSTGTVECVLELENGGGVRMRVHLHGVSAPDLVALSRSFWGEAS